MIDNIGIKISELFRINILEYLKNIWTSPLQTIAFIFDILIVVFLVSKFVQAVKGTRAWQLLKGIILLICLTALSSILGLNILNFILTSFMTYGVIFLIIVFQPELRRGLEQLGTNKLTKFFGMDKDIIIKAKEDIYKIVIAVSELAKSKTGALIVIERDIKIKDIIDTGIIIDGEISPQLLVNIFLPNTPLHDGAVIISNNKLAAAACILPLASDKDIAKELGTRHRAAIGISKETDALAIVVSEETGKVSVARDGILIADLREDALKKILIKNVVTSRFGDINEQKKIKVRKMKSKITDKVETENKDEE